MNTYGQAREEINVATKAFRVAQIAYRARKINDIEFLAAKATYLEAEKKFDAAFAIATKDI